MTAWYAARQVKGIEVERAVDIGCGIGSVLMMMAWRLQETRFIGVEAQDISVGLAGRSILFNGIEGRVEVRHGDLREPEMIPEGAVFDLVTGTPPYIPIGDGVMSQREQCGPCRFELRGGVEDYCLAAARLLAPGGRFVVCQASAQRARVEAAAQGAGLHILRYREIVPREGRDPLFTVFSMTPQTEQNPATVADSPFMVRDAKGDRTAQYLEVRRDMGMP
jgi:tRNA1(Val) A37 N6-methylase TrmN6